MFPYPERRHQPAGPGVNALRRALDLVVAFATLRDAELPPDDGEERAPSPGGAGTRGVHPHRRALRGPAHARRPGAVPPQAQHCTTPLAARRVSRAGASASRSAHT
jgi:hypothetical protein